MKQKLFLLTLGILLVIPTALKAQLSDRVNAPSTYVIGTRPAANDMGIQIGTSYDDIANILDDNKNFEALPVVTFKHYRTASQVLTLGFKTDKEKYKLKGTENGTGEEAEFVDMLSHFLLVPGLEKHFGSANILDVYGGARIPFGLEREKNIQSYAGNGLETTRNSFGIGVDLFVGIQAFIGDLPLALGLEMDYSMFTVLGDKYKVVQTGAISNEYYTYDPATYTPAGVFPNQFDALSASRTDFTGDFRVSLVYFFRR